MTRRVTLLLVLLAGCSGTSSAEKSQPAFSLAFEIRDPVEMLHGAERCFVVESRRKDGFDLPITLHAEVTPAGKGVAAIVEERTNKVTVSISETAQSGDYIIHVTGKAAVEDESIAVLPVYVPRKE